MYCTRGRGYSEDSDKKGRVWKGPCGAESVPGIWGVGGVCVCKPEGSKVSRQYWGKCKAGQNEPSCQHPWITADHCGTHLVFNNWIMTFYMSHRRENPKAYECFFSFFVHIHERGPFRCIKRLGVESGSYFTQDLFNLLRANASPDK